MPLQTTTAVNSLPAPRNLTKHALCVALTAHLALLAGCSGTRGAVIDYTVTEEEYYAALGQQKPTLAALTPIPAPAQSAAIAHAQALQQAAQAAQATKEPVKAPPRAAFMAKRPNAPVEEPEEAADLQIASLDVPAEKFSLAKMLDNPRAENAGFSRSFYTSAGFGMARFDPDTSADPAYSVNDNNGGGGQLAIGYDLTKRFAIELHTADYGSAGLNPVGRVEYQMNGGSALVYLGKRSKQYNRAGLNTYARFGFNQLTNSPIGANNPFIKQTTTLGAAGLGAEYNTTSGLGVRADVIAYAGNVQYGQLGLVYRFGNRSKLPELAVTEPAPVETKSKVKIAAANPVAPSATRATEPLLAAAISAAARNASEGVTQSQDLAQLPTNPAWNRPASPYGSDVQLQRSQIQNVEYTCASLNGSLPELKFRGHSAELTAGAYDVLDKIAYTLSTCSDLGVMVSGHTDNEGSARANHVLSGQRAKAVAMHLAATGVDTSRIRAVAFGESRPITSNLTVQGRTSNNRIELRVQ